jgi:hypothetical protein
MSDQRMASLARLEWWRCQAFKVLGGVECLR